jgi:hypothetical protein
MSISWHSFLYIPIWLYLENEEEVEVPKRRHHHLQNLRQEIVSTLISADPSLTHLSMKASPGAFATLLDAFKIFLTCLMH